MLERYLQAVRTDDPVAEEPVATRERLKNNFPPGATRRMTQLGLLIGAALNDLAPTAEDTLVYATGFGESRALEAYLASFPTPSPTLFQTSIHPSGAQQALIGRQRPIREFFPLAGGAQLTAQALLTAVLAPTPRVLLCGGEERATWLTEHGVASDRTFAFALALTRDPGPSPLGKITLTPTAANSATPLPLAEWFDLLHTRRPFHGPVANGQNLTLSWT
jgi:hypothetical protein